MTSSNRNKFRVTGHLFGEFTCHGEFPAQKPVTRSFDVFFDLGLNKRLGKQSWGWWFETPSCSLLRHCNEWRPLCLGRNVLMVEMSCPLLLAERVLGNHQTPNVIDLMDARKRSFGTATFFMLFYDNLNQKSSFQVSAQSVMMFNWIRLFPP